MNTCEIKARTPQRSRWAGWAERKPQAQSVNHQNVTGSLVGVQERPKSVHKNTKHGYAAGRIAKVYRVWCTMKERCQNPNHDHYKDYGGRGIRVCDRWQGFQNFISDMGDRPEGLTLERINNDGNYEPLNCKWATRAEQGANKRSNVKIDCFGITKTQKQVSAMIGITNVTCAARIKKLKAANMPISLKNIYVMGVRF